MDVPEFAAHEAAVAPVIEDDAHHEAERGEEPGGEPEESDAAADSDHGARAHDVHENGVEERLRLRQARRQECLEHRLRHAVRRCGGLVEDVAEAGGEQEEEGQSGQEHIEGHATSDEEHVVGVRAPVDLSDIPEEGGQTPSSSPSNASSARPAS